MSDIAVYSKKEAQPTSGAGAIALLIGPNPIVAINPTRSSHFMNAYDFYKPELPHDYPIVNGKFSTDVYIKSFILNWRRFKNKTNKSLMDFDYFCLHCPFTKQVRKSFIGLIFNEIKNDPLFLKKMNLNKKEIEELNNFITKEISFYDRSVQLFLKKVSYKIVKDKLEQGLYIPSMIGNIYTGSLYLSLISLFYHFKDSPQNLQNKNILLYSYGSGLASSILSLTVTGDTRRISGFIDSQTIYNDLSHAKIYTCEEYLQIQKENEKYYGKNDFSTKLHSNPNTNIPELNKNAFFLKSVNKQYIREYIFINEQKLASIFTQVKTQSLSSLKISNLKNHKLRELSVSERQKKISDQFEIPSLIQQLISGGLTENSADNMTENCIGRISMPLSIIEKLCLNGKNYSVPMSTEEASVVAAANRSCKLIREKGGGFWGKNTRNVIRGQIYVVDFAGMNKTEFVNRDHGSQYYYTGKNLLKNCEVKQNTMKFELNKQSLDSTQINDEIPKLSMESGIDSMTYLKDYNHNKPQTFQVIYKNN